MTAQQQGMIAVGTAVRALVPPQLDYVVLVYPRDGKMTPERVSYVTSTTVSELENRAIDAAAVFATKAKSNLSSHQS